MYKLVLAVLVAILALGACGSSSKSGSTTASGGSGNDFSSLVAKAKTSSFRVTYRKSDGTSITTAQDAKGRQSIQDGNTLVISDGTNTVSCDGTTPAATCHDLGTLGEGTVQRLTALLTSIYSGIASSSVFAGPTSSATIAGRDATCVPVKMSALPGVFGSIAAGVGSGASATVCVDNETGVLLKLSGGSGGNTTDVLIATEFRQPSDRDFQPPSTPQSG
jgi:hypothetical protein